MQNNLLKSLILLAFSLVVFSGCVGNSVPPAQKPTSKAIPAWITSALPSDNAKYMYGMAIEADREAAVKAALSDMIAKLGTTIESSYESNQEVQGSYSKSVTKSYIKADVSKIKINNYKVIKSHKVSYREFAVMIETDKQRFVKGLKENLQAQKKSISQKNASVMSSDSLTRYNTKKDLAEKSSKLLSTIFIISDLDKGFDKQKNLNFVNEQQKELNNESIKLKFFVSGNKKSIKFTDSIKNHLAQNGYNVTSSKKNAVHIQINSTDNISEIGSKRIAVITINVIVMDNKQRIGGKSTIIKERYNNSISSVYKNASIHLEQDIKKEGINELLGINVFSTSNI